MSTNPKENLYSVDDSCVVEHDDAVFMIARARVLKLLFARRSASLEEIIREARISLNSLARVFISLSDLNVLARTDDGLLMTPAGVKWTVLNRRYLFMQRHKVVYQPPLMLRGIADKVREHKKLPEGYISD